MEAALTLVNPNDVETKALSYISQAKAVTVVDSTSYTMAGELWKAGREVMKAIDDGYDSIIATFYKGHKDAVAKKKSYYEPVEAATRHLKSIMSTYDAAQEAIRQAEQRRLEEIARKAAEEEALLAAIAAEEEAKRNGATKEEAKQEAEAIISQPIYVPPVVLAKETPKVQGLSFRTIWKFKIERPELLPREYTMPDEVKIGQVVRALKGSTNIPGVKAYEERC